MTRPADAAVALSAAALSLTMAMLLVDAGSPRVSATAVGVATFAALLVTWFSRRRAEPTRPRGRRQARVAQPTEPTISTTAARPSESVYSTPTIAHRPSSMARVSATE